ncbi:glycosyltransferase family 2 protein [Streptomyces zingiberis]|uniref:Glycosyltransferase family 2 protein n=1 Tax=Streptomyces zingiberis TaxID=2053010 RepID=A0ABX1C062_9ACTN|nr:glycosyltransferase family 2 protein [Streptomyces zingiberis]NJQ02768.1 glycosyltransferase family 2 protein [Streptomyces zingiberis]
MTKLSVIVPCYNVERYLPDTLHSLAANAAEHIEFILVDDHSTDATSEILDRARRTLPRATVIRQPENGGISHARNTGLAAASGRYVTFLDGDDWYGRGHLDDLLSAAESLGCDFVRTDHVQCTGTTRVVRRAPAPVRGTVVHPRDTITPAHRETMVDYPFVWAGVYHRRLFEDGALRFDTGLRTAEDRLWTWRLYLAAETSATVGLLGVFYRRGVTTSLTQILDERQLDFLPAHDAMLELVLADPERDRFLPKVVRTYCALIAFHLAKAGRYQPRVARRLKREAAAALGRMPEDVLERTLAEIGPERARLLDGLRPGGARGRRGGRGPAGTTGDAEAGRVPVSRA